MIICSYIHEHIKKNGYSRFCALRLAVSREASSTLAGIGAVCVRALRLGVTVVEAESTLVHIRTQGVRPASVLLVHGYVVPRGHSYRTRV